MKKIKVVELFAGVGGFRLGLEKNKQFEVVWSNQWEPASKAQHASDVYINRFGSNMLIIGKYVINNNANIAAIINGYPSFI